MDPDRPLYASAPHWLADDPTHPARHDTLVLSGPDAGRYLQSQLSQDVASLAVGQGVWSLLLEPTGRVVALVRVDRSGDEEYTIAVDTGHGAEVRDRLGRFMIRMKLEMSEVVPGVMPDDAAHRRRIEAAWPAIGAEIIPGETLPAQTGVVGIAVSFTKGCYPGQELVERMDSRGATAPRVLRRLTVEAGTRVGDPVYRADDQAEGQGEVQADDQGEVVGEITSVAGTTALAMVRRGMEIGEAVDHR